jgi:hypothetical protein
MPRVGFELTIPVFERVKIVHALDCAATVTGSSASYPLEILNAYIFLLGEILTVYMWPVIEPQTLCMYGLYISIWTSTGTDQEGMI